MKFRIHWVALVAAFATNGVPSVQAQKQKDGTCLEALTDTTSGKAGVCTPIGVPPMIDGASFMSEAVVKDQASTDVFGCCSKSDQEEDVLTQSIIGKMPQFTTERSLAVLEEAKKAWNHGQGVWPQMSLQGRIEKIEEFLEALHEQRSAIINLLMWEIGKNYLDATAEFDRTIAFSKKVRDNYVDCLFGPI